jgi:hypothetical protein
MTGGGASCVRGAFSTFEKTKPPGEPASVVHGTFSVDLAVKRSGGLEVSNASKHWRINVVIEPRVSRFSM